MSILMSQIKEKAQHWEVMDRTNEGRKQNNTIKKI